LRRGSALLKSFMEEPTTPILEIPETTATFSEPAPNVRGNIRSAALWVLAVLAAIFFLHQAKDVLVPVVLAILLSYAMNPLVDWCSAWRIPRSLSAGILLLAIVGLLSFSVYALDDQLTTIVNGLPEAAQNIRQVIREELRGNGSRIQKMQQAARELEKAAKEATGAPVTGSRPAPFPAAESSFNLQSYLWSGSLGALGFVTQIFIVLFLTYFILASGDLFKRKIMRVVGPSLVRKKVAIQILEDIETQMARFLRLQLFVSVLVGVASWLTLKWIGVDHPAAWGFANALATWIPYFGPAAITVVMVVMGYMQFGTMSTAALIGGVLVVIRTLEGMLLLPWLTGCQAHMNTVAVFIAILFFGWIWGVWGILLASPLMMAFKVVCDHIETLKPVSELLGD
jgi:predicted PurR-regulated permease PerM